MGTKKNSESDTKSEQKRAWFQTQALEKRVIALERGLEAVLRRMEESSGPDDEAGWYGRPE